MEQKTSKIKTSIRQLFNSKPLIFLAVSLVVDNRLRESGNRAAIAQ